MNIRDIIKGKVKFLRHPDGYETIVDESCTRIADTTASFFNLEDTESIEKQNLLTQFIVEAINEKLEWESLRDCGLDDKLDEII